MSDKEYEDACLRLARLRLNLHTVYGITGEYHCKDEMNSYKYEYFKLRKEILEERRRRENG